MPCSEIGQTNLNKKFTVQAAYSLGATFLEWSTYFLSGQNKYFNTKHENWITLTDNPITAESAHGHDKNHPSGLDAVLTTIQRIEQESTGMFSFYPYCHEYNYWAEHLGYSLDSLNNDQWQQIYQLQLEELTEIAAACCHANYFPIYLHADEDCQPYILQSRTQPLWLKEIAVFNLGDNDIYAKYKHIKTQWDLREQLALDIRPFEKPVLINYIDRTQPHLYINAWELWYNGYNILLGVLDALNLRLDHSRVESWLRIYQSWQSIQLSRSMPLRTIATIVDAIVNNHYYPLPQLNLIQEAIILHCLLYQHNLNLRNWQLTTFPNNTQLLYQLLEPNHHFRTTS